VIAKENVGVSEKIICDVSSFIQMLTKAIPENWDFTIFDSWKSSCLNWKEKYEVIKEPHIIDEGAINFYEFADMLSELLIGNETIVTDAGSAFYVMGQAFKIKDSQRYIVSGGLGAMGYALPSSLGVSTADKERTVICVTGDGSLQTNIQELQTMCHYNMNVKLFVINNEGYVSIRNTHNTYFSGHLVGTSEESGVSIPSLNKIADAYQIPFVECNKRSQLRDAISETIKIKGPVICGITAQPDQQIIPTVSSVRLENGSMQSRPLHDMFPFLDPEEMELNMS
jgi:acetolactate synthase I/II/III large subunit